LAPALGIWATFIGAIATFVVAINPPLNFQTLLKTTYRCLQGKRTLLAAPLCSHLENDFQLDRGAEWKACYAKDKARRDGLVAEDISKQLRRRIGDLRVSGRSVLPNAV
jgi:hypothetical protein